MSVSALDTSVSVSSTTDTALADSKPEARANRSFSVAPSYDSHSAGNVSYNLSVNVSGPVFGVHQQTAQGHTDHHHWAPAMTHSASQQGFMQQFQHAMGHWFGRQRPDAHAHHNGVPPTPVPVGSGKPDLVYAHKSNDQLAQLLLNNFAAFTGSSHSKTLSARTLKDMAAKQLGSDPKLNENIRTAREVLRRTGMMDALGSRTDLHTLAKLIRDDNPFKYKDDKQIAQEMLNHFNQLKDYVGHEINIKDLQTLGKTPTTGIPSIDHLIQLSKAFTGRGGSLKKMDADADGRINVFEILVALSR